MYYVFPIPGWGGDKGDEGRLRIAGLIIAGLFPSNRSKAGLFTAGLFPAGLCSAGPFEAGPKCGADCKQHGMAIQAQPLSLASWIALGVSWLHP
jgi:hypothetical protein